MRTRTALALAAGIVVLAGCSTAEPNGAGFRAGGGQGRGGGGGGGPAGDRAPVTTVFDDTELDAAAIQALQRAVDEEAAAVGTYAAFIERIGEVRPFTAIVVAEQRHLDALLAVAANHGLDLTAAEPAVGDLPGTRADACALGADLEVADAALYDELLPAVDEHDDIVAVFTNLQRASLDRHLPAFERCS